MTKVWKVGFFVVRFEICIGGVGVGVFVRGVGFVFFSFGTFLTSF